jgi:hypothetical protein
MQRTTCGPNFISVGLVVARQTASKFGIQSAKVRFKAVHYSKQLSALATHLYYPLHCWGRNVTARFVVCGYLFHSPKMFLLGVLITNISSRRTTRSFSGVYYSHEYTWLTQLYPTQINLLRLLRTHWCSMLVEVTAFRVDQLQVNFMCCW